MTDRCTYWTEAQPSNDNPYGGGYDNPKTLPCNHMNDSDMQVDSEGAEFKPSAAFRLNADTITQIDDGNVSFMVAGVSYTIRKGDRIALGEYTDSSPVTSAKTVRKVVSKTKLRGQSGVTVYCG